MKKQNNALNFNIRKMFLQSPHGLGKIGPEQSTVRHNLVKLLSQNSKYTYSIWISMYPKPPI